MNGAPIVGYLYGQDGDIYCPDCIRELFLPFDLIADSAQTTESVLDRIARERRINRYDERSYSARQFPVPIYLGDATSDDTCVSCGQRLAGSDAAPW